MISTHVRRSTDEGGSGDIRIVWTALASRCRWVTGVAGNHDIFGEAPSVPDFEAFRKAPGVHFLDGQAVVLDGLKIAGLSGVIGNPRRPFRRTEATYQEALGVLLNSRPDILVLHEGPDVPDSDLKGNTVIRQAIAARATTLVVCGHAHWDPFTVDLTNGSQVLNADARVFLLTQHS